MRASRSDDGIGRDLAHSGRGPRDESGESGRRVRAGGDDGRGVGIGTFKKEDSSKKTCPLERGHGSLKGYSTFSFARVPDMRISFAPLVKRITRRPSSCVAPRPV